MMNHRILELYSGIGGMHCAWNESSLPGEIIAAVDINTVANHVYKHNFPGIKVLTRNIQAISPEEFIKLNVNTILMSPPCQPFTRNGKFLDENDARTNSFIYMLNILKELNSIQYILLENVKGFECSSVRNTLIQTLDECGFVYQEFLLSPTCVGVPNSRLRYYVIARRNPSWNFKRSKEIVQHLETKFPDPYCLEEILEPGVDDQYLVPHKHLKRGKVLDICWKESTRSCCFTKSYSHFIEGTGSVFTDASPEEVESCYKLANNYEVGSDEFIECLKPLKLRFFTPKEVLSLMAFPEAYSFPEDVTRKQCYRLLGNSVNVKVISELLKILFS